MSAIAALVQNREDPELGTLLAYTIFHRTDEPHSQAPLLYVVRRTDALVIMRDLSSPTIYVGDGINEGVFAWMRVLWSIAPTTRSISPLEGRGCDQTRSEFLDSGMRTTEGQITIGFDQQGNLHFTEKCGPRARHVEIDPTLGVSPHELNVLFGG